MGRCGPVVTDVEGVLPFTVADRLFLLAQLEQPGDDSTGDWSGVDPPARIRARGGR